MYCSKDRKCKCILEIVKDTEMYCRGDERKSLEKVAIAPKAAKTVLRVKRGWSSIRRALNPFERKEEREERVEAAKRERHREALERSREHQVMLDR